MHKPILTIAAFAALAASSAAHAVEIDFVGPNTDMGTVADGQFGTLNFNFIVTPMPHMPPINAISSLASGMLPIDTEITFSYQLPTLLHEGARLSSTYSYMDEPNVVNGEADAKTHTPFGSSSAPLASATASLTSNSGTTVIDNTSDGTLNFATFFSGLLHQGITQFTYDVTAITGGVGIGGDPIGGPIPLDPVPLPASAFLLLAALLALCGMYVYPRRNIRLN